MRRHTLAILTLALTAAGLSELGRPAAARPAGASPWGGGTLVAEQGAAAPYSEAFLDTIQQASFQFFWNEANPANGLIKDRNTSGSPCSIASEGFGLTAICIGIDHGWVTRAAGRDRVLTALQTFWTMPQGSAASGTVGYKGFFYHFLDMGSATRTWDSELSSIDTALLLAGVLDAKQYFTQDDPAENQIRALADSIYYRVDWNFMRNFNPGILMGWKPGTGFGGFGQWIGYNEAMILYVLAIGSPTHPVPPDTWSTWTSGYQWQTHYGYSYVNFPPLFGHQYSHCWIDFRGIVDSYMLARGSSYFENSRRATLAQRAYCAANPFAFAGYSDTLWGITASDTPTGYAARGAPPPQGDDGTIAPTAAAASLPFAPEAVIPTLRNFYFNYRIQLWVPYGFRDAFNLTQNWWDPDVIGIDQGPIVLMIENHRTGAVWSRFMRNADVQRGLQLAGFVPGGVSVDREPRGEPEPVVLAGSEPNPFTAATTIRFRLAAGGHVRLGVFDVQGREVARLVDDQRTAGLHAATLRGDGLASGVYHLRLECDGAVRVKRCVRLQ